MVLPRYAVVSSQQSVVSGDRGATWRGPIRTQTPASRGAIGHLVPDNDLLSYRQDRLYQHVAALWRPSENRSAATGKPAATTWTLVYVGIRCYFETGDSQKAPEGFLLVEADNIMVLDKVHMHESIEIRATDVLQQCEGPEPGRFFAVKGDANQRTRHAMKLMVRASRLPVAPDGIG